ncbi:MAG TPA: helix-turn-helix transcriptional regulator [Treponemataceae bacterium]|nr:helix-turn-helix transcriptional regulator [Treponemataceae bacterium]
MPVLLLLSFAITSVGLAALIFAGARWAQTPQSATRFHKAAFFVAAAGWVILLRFAIVNFSWQTGTSAHAWFRRFAPMADGTSLLLASLSAVALGVPSRSKKTRADASRPTATIFFPVSVAFAAVSLLAAIADYALPTHELTVIIDKLARVGTIWIAILPFLTILTGRKELQRDGSLPYARVLAAMAVTYALAMATLRRIGVDPTWTALLVSFALFAALTAINVINATPIQRADQTGPAQVNATRSAGTAGTVGTAGIPHEWGLTARENEIVSLLIAGKTNNEIAEALFISAKTVETHLYNIYRKTDVSSRVQLVAAILSGAK